MQGGRSGQVAAAVVSQRLCDLLLQFPAAAIGGVRWKVLVKRYEDRYGGKLDIASLGHSSNVAAATALLWDLLRFGSTEDPENPIIAIEDGIALTPRPSMSGTWPSLYVSLRAAVLNSGAVESPTEAEAAAGVQVRGLLLSQLKPLLQSHWHANFDEYGMGFYNEEGNFVKLKKMKHLVQAVLQWRDQRVAWREASGSKLTDLDKVLYPKLELLVSKTHNDLVLRCPENAEATSVESPPLQETSKAKVVSKAVESVTPERTTASSKEVQEDLSSTCSTVSRQVPVEEDLERELAELRAENAALRWNNEHLLRERDSVREMTYKFNEEQLLRPMLFAAAPSDVVQDQHDLLDPDMFDNPFEPPPQRPRSWSTAYGTPTAASTATPSSASNFGLLSGPPSRMSMTPMSGFEVQSGAMTPVQTAAGEKVCALVPLWLSWLPSTASVLGDRSNIPTGIVGRLRSHFEAAADTRPLQPTQAWRL